MKKLISILTILGFFIISCNNKKSEVKVINKQSVSDSITLFERLEGKVVMSDKDEWFVIKDGLRWRAMSEPATTDYLKSIEDGQNHIEKNVSSKILEEFPVVGEILPNVNFKIYENK